MHQHVASAIFATSGPGVSKSCWLWLGSRWLLARGTPCQDATSFDLLLSVDARWADIGPFSFPTGTPSKQCKPRG
jgi:hypothetical protein